jgi:cell division protein FtsW (lipid II flippase)
VDQLAETMPPLTASDLVAVKPFFVMRTRDAFRSRLLWFGGSTSWDFVLIAGLAATRDERRSMLLAAAHLLTAVGFAVLVSRVDPLRDNLLFVRYAEGVLVGLLLLGALSLIDFGTATFLELSYLPLIAALSLSVPLILFGTGPGRSGAKVNLGPVQPIEAIRLLLALFLAGFFARRWELLRDLRGKTIRTLTVPAWLDVPRGEYVLPVLVAVATALGFFFLQKDLGPALLLSCVFLAMYAVAEAGSAWPRRGSCCWWLAISVPVECLAYTRRARRMWQSPWDNAVAGGDQVAQSIWAMATGGTFGTGPARRLVIYPRPHGSRAGRRGRGAGAVGLLAVTLAHGVVTWRFSGEQVGVERLRLFLEPRSRSF